MVTQSQLRFPDNQGKQRESSPIQPDLTNCAAHFVLVFSRLMLTFPVTC